MLLLFASLLATRGKSHPLTPSTPEPNGPLTSAARDTARRLLARLRVTYLRPLDLSVDEALAELLSSVRESGATRVVTGEAPLDALAAAAGVTRADADRHIERLVALGYAVRVSAAGNAGDSYQAFARVARR